MSSFLDLFNQTLATANSVLWHPITLYALLAVGVLFTVWSGFSQYRAVTHGTRVVLGHFEKPGDPGAISHFQALSAALSATVGIGNIGGVALAIALGGPGAVFWMWVVGFLGMAIKTVEVTLSLRYRNVDDPENPHGGPMWVISRGLAAMRPGLAPLGRVIGGAFCVTLAISAFTGGNFFQAWNVGTVSQTYFGIPSVVAGIVLAVLVGMVILGGIHRIGTVAGRIVPFMCAAYLLAVGWVLMLKLGEVPALFGLIVRGAFEPMSGSGAFLGGTLGLAFSTGLQRAFFSNEAGQGSSPIAHAAARTREPAREGLVAGLEPLIDTLVVCTLTALVILASGAWNRAPELTLTTPPAVMPAAGGGWTLESARLPAHPERPWQRGDTVLIHLRADANPSSGNDLHNLTGTVRLEGEEAWADWGVLASRTQPEVVEPALYIGYTGAALTAHAFDRVVPGLGKWLVTLASWLFALSTLISWNYYGEQSVAFLFSERWVKAYKIAYCLFIVVACSGIVRSTTELNNLSLLGTGVMLWANIPITLLFAHQAMGELRSYWRRMEAAGELDG